MVMRASSMGGGYLCWGMGWLEAAMWRAKLSKDPFMDSSSFDQTFLWTRKSHFPPRMLGMSRFRREPRPHLRIHHASRAVAEEGVVNSRGVLMKFSGPLRHIHLYTSAGR